MSFVFSIYSQEASTFSLSNKANKCISQNGEVISIGREANLESNKFYKQIQIISGLMGF